MNQENQLLDVLTREGVLVNLSIRYWRGTKKLRAEDLGLDPENVSDRLIALGHKRLLPKEATEALTLVESRAHAFIESNTFPFLNGLAHFTPNAKLEEISEAMKSFEEEFWAAKAEFLERYGALRESAANEWRDLATKLVPNPEQLLASIEASFPPALKLEKSFGFEFMLFQISAPERLGLDLVALEDQRQMMTAREQAAQKAAAKIRNEAESFVAECVASLREQTARLCEEMLQSINNSETGVHQKTLNRLIRFIDQFKQMNFTDDKVMEEQLEQVRQEFLSRTAVEYRESNYARQQLVQGLSKLAEHAKQLAQADATEVVQRFGQLGIRKFNLAA